MANYASLLSTINNTITDNNVGAIDGPALNDVLTQMVAALGTGYQFVGVATPSTSPASTDAKVFYIAGEAGTYTNFGGLSVAAGEVAILKYDTAWSKVSTPIASAAEVSQLGQKVDELDTELHGADEVSFAHSQFDDIGGLITGGVFRNAGMYGTNNDFVLIPVTRYKGRSLYVQPVSGTLFTTIGFLTSDVLVDGQVPPFCSGETDVRNIYSNTTLTIPSDCNYIYVYVRHGSDGDKFPTTLRVSGVDSSYYTKSETDDLLSGLQSDVDVLQTDVEGLEKDINGLSGSHTYTGTGYDFNVALKSGDLLEIEVSDHTTYVVSIYAINTDNTYSLLLNLTAGNNSAAIEISATYKGFRTFFNTSGQHSVNWSVSGGIGRDVEVIKNKRDTTFVRASFRSVLCVGDSVTHGLISDYPVVGYNTSLASYPVYLGKLTGWNVKNAGRSSWNTKEWYNQWFANYNYSDYDLAFIEFGYNRGFTDTLATDAPLAVNWVSGTSYLVGDVVTYNRLRYKCINANSDSVWTPANWTAAYTDYADTDTGDYCRIIEGMLAQNPALCIAIVIPARFAAGNTSRNVIEAIANRYALPIVDLHSDKYFDLNATEYHGYLDAEHQASETLDLTHFNALGYLVKAESLLKLFCDAIWSVKTYFNANIEDRFLATSDPTYNYDYEGYINMA